MIVSCSSEDINLADDRDDDDDDGVVVVNDW